MFETVLKQRRTEYCQALDDAVDRILDHLTKMPEAEVYTQDAALGAAALAEEAVVWVEQLLGESKGG